MVSDHCGLSGLTSELWGVLTARSRRGLGGKAGGRPCRPGVPRTGVGEADVVGRLALPSRAAVVVAALRLSAADCCLFHNVS